MSFAQPLWYLRFQGIANFFKLWFICFYLTALMLILNPENSNFFNVSWSVGLFSDHLLDPSFVHCVSNIQNDKIQYDVCFESQRSGIISNSINYYSLSRFEPGPSNPEADDLSMCHHTYFPPCLNISQMFFDVIPRYSVCFIFISLDIVLYAEYTHYTLQMFRISGF